MKFEAWQFDYMYYLYPNMDTSITNNVVDYEVLNKLNFETEKAKAFKAGYKASARLIVEEVTMFMKQYKKEL